MAPVPKTMKAWQFSSTKGGLPSNLSIIPNAPVPKPKQNQVLVKVQAVALNPVDFKPAEVALLHSLLFAKPATPGLDFVGTIVQLPPTTKTTLDASFNEGQVVYGSGQNILGGGMLAEYAVADVKCTLPLIEGMSPLDGAGLTLASMTAYQAMYSRVPSISDTSAKRRSRVFINGGSGGVGTLGIQIAKLLGHHVTVTCSTRNVELCRSLGADEIIDYTSTEGTLIDALKSKTITPKHSNDGVDGNGDVDKRFGLIVDNVFADTMLYWKSREYTTPNAIYALNAFSPTNLPTVLKMKLWPRNLGGARRRLDVVMVKPITNDMEQLRTWCAEKKLRVIIDQVFPFDQVVEAFKKLKTGRAVGKIIVQVE